MEGINKKMYSDIAAHFSSREKKNNSYRWTKKLTFIVQYYTMVIIYKNFEANVFFCGVKISFFLKMESAQQNLFDEIVKKRSVWSRPT